MPLPRFRLRTLMIAVAVVGFVLATGMGAVRTAVRWESYRRFAAWHDEKEEFFLSEVHAACEGHSLVGIGEDRLETAKRCLDQAAYHSRKRRAYEGKW